MFTGFGALRKHLRVNVYRTGGMMRSITARAADSYLADFLSLATAKRPLPVLSLEAFAQQKTVSELTRVDLCASSSSWEEEEEADSNSDDDDDDDVVLQGFVLPAGMSWPFFRVDKQRWAKDKHILVHRVQGMNAVRDREVFRAVNELCESVAIIGSPGTGKSCSMNFFLMEFVRHLGEPGWKKTVLARYGSIFLEIFREEVSGEIRCKKSAVCSLQHVEKKLDQYSALSGEERSQMVLLLELNEREEDPQVGDIPCVVTVSIDRDAREVLGTMERTGGLHWFLDEAHSEEEAEAFVRLMNAASPSGDKYDWENVVQPRWGAVPRPREYLSTAPLRTEVSDGVFEDMNRTSIFFVPESVSNLLNPYYDDEATNPDLRKRLPGNQPCYGFRFSSLEIAFNVGKKMKSN